MDNLDKTFDLQDPQLVSVIDELSIWAAPFGLRMLEAIKYRKNIAVLDIGFGTGFPLLEVAMRLGQGSRVYGIDPWSAGIARAREKAARFGLDNVELIEGRAENIPLPDKSIDLIVSNNGINNVEDARKVLSECARVSKTGAQFLATMNLETSMLEFYDTMEAVLRNEGFLGEIEAMKKHIYAKRKPLSEVTSLLQRSGFRVVQIIQDTYAYRFASGTAMLNHHFIRLAFLGAWASIVPGEQRNRIFGQIEARLNVIAEREGCLSLSIPFALIEGQRS